MQGIRSHKKNFYLFMIATTAALSGILFGYDTGVISGAILFINGEFNLSPQMNGLVVSAVLFGAVCGSLCSGRITDHFGRRKILIVVSLVFISASFISAFAQTVAELISGRIIVGFAIGIASYVAPLYISEISPTKQRGALVSLNQVAISVGILISYFVDYFLAQHEQWRWMLGLGVIPGFLLLIGMILLPESPRWLLANNQAQEAVFIMRRIRGNHLLEEVDIELQTITSNLEVQTGHWSTLFSKNIRKALFIAVGLAVIQQFIGINTILYYAPTILTITNYQGVSGAILSAIPVGIVFVVFSIISIPLIDKVGRRPLLISGLAGMALGLAILAWVFSNPERTPFLQIMSVAGMLLYVACFAFSLGPVMWLMIAELFPLSVRGWGSSLATAVNWGSNMVVTFTFLMLVNTLGASGTFLVYFGFTLLSLVFVHYFVPETKNISLEDIERNLYAGKPARYIGAY
ncbi:MAG: sugar porter family MFS transporter [Gammaproteobacteria bacterium]